MPETLTAELYTAGGDAQGTVELNPDIFGIEPNTAVMHQVVTAQLAAARSGTASTKTRGEVRGGGKKPWRQKGTGRARVGETRNPLWRKGGTVFGPQPRSYEYQLPRKVEKGALRAALAEKIQGGALIVVENLAAAEVKTKAAVGMLRGIGVNGKALLVDVRPDEKLALSVRNVPGVFFLPSNRITARDVAATRTIVVTPAALEKLEAALG